ncbi:PBECR2 nuclease fold domain-containing protein [uncultured Clostridium sp.]|uniref:PBECR3 domain-containing polyvalent protein n=1 Tax=uncultured Clostridium sp. TaxID=59620 RepID=UPI002612A80C|nr:PBECR2 nuclease fold domain-containing protein [uncultured Clostridium sp.]
MERQYETYKKVGRLDKKFLRDIDLKSNGNIYIHKSVFKHIRKKHGRQLTRYVRENISKVIETIIKSPEYIGISKSENKISLKLVKKIDVQIVIVVEYDKIKKYFYISTMYPLIKSRIISKIESGKLKIISG